MPELGEAPVPLWSHHSPACCPVLAFSKQSAEPPSHNRGGMAIASVLDPISHQNHSPTWLLP